MESLEPVRSTFQAAQQALFNAKSLMLVKFIINPVNLPVVLLVDEGELAAAFQEVTKITESHLEKLDVILDSLQRVGERPLAHLHRLNRDPLQQLPRVNLITKMSFIILGPMGQYYQPQK